MSTSASPVGDKGGKTARRTLRVASKCGTLEEFVVAYRRYVDETSVFIVTANPPAVGARRHFTIQLGTGEPVMSGEGEIIEAVTDGGGPFRRNGMRLRLIEMDARSRETHAALLARKKAATPPALPPAPPAPAAFEPPTEVEPAPTERPQARPPTGGGPAPVEARRPGSPLTLPANPFSELPEQALEHFVECTLYEDTIGGEGVEAAAFASPPPAPAPAPPPAPAPAPAPAPVSEEIDLSALVPEAVTRPATAPPVPPPPSPPPSLAEALAPEAPVFVAPAAAPASPALMAPIEPPVAAAPSRAGLLAGVALVVGVGIGVLVGYLVWGGVPAPTAASSAPAADPVAARASVTPPRAPIPPPAAPERIVTPDAGAAAPVAEPPVVEVTADEECTLDVVTDPEGAEVLLGRSSLGPTPLAGVAVPCGELKLAIEHPRYERVSKTLQATAGKPVVIRETLDRPEGTLSVVSKPSGAAIIVGSSAIGKAPASTKVNAFTHIEVKASLAGHKPWSRKVYVRGRSMTLEITLEALPKPPKPPKRKPQ